MWQTNSDGFSPIPELLATIDELLATIDTDAAGRHHPLRFTTHWRRRIRPTRPWALSDLATQASTSARKGSLLLRGALFSAVKFPPAVAVSAGKKHSMFWLPHCTLAEGRQRGRVLFAPPNQNRINIMYTWSAITAVLVLPVTPASALPADDSAPALPAAALPRCAVTHRPMHLLLLVIRTWLCWRRGAVTTRTTHYVSKQLDPDDVVSDCSLNHHAFFLLLVEPGVFLGANGWHEDYDKP